MEHPPEERAALLEDWVRLWLDVEWHCLEGLANSYIQTALGEVDWQRLTEVLCEEEKEEKEDAP